MIITMSSIGLPTLNGFIGEFLILIGAYNHSWVWALFAASGIVLGAGYMLWMYQRVFFGELTNEKNKDLADLNRREQWTLIPLDHHRLLDRALSQALLQADRTHGRSRARSGSRWR